MVSTLLTFFNNKGQPLKLWLSLEKSFTSHKAHQDNVVLIFQTVSAFHNLKEAAHLEKLGPNLSSSLFVIRVNLLHP